MLSACKGIACHAAQVMSISRFEKHLGQIGKDEPPTGANLMCSEPIYHLVPIV